MSEEQRIQAAYEKLNAQNRTRFFGYENMVHLFRKQERHRATLSLFQKVGIHNTLAGKKILDIGCGDGNMLRQFLEWGAEPQDLAGIELRSEVVDKARRLNPAIEVRIGSAAELPWEDSQFDLVCQHTVFTSILDQAIRQQVAAEMRRVLRPGGGILWYDFMYDNPRNPDVKRVTYQEIQHLFPGFDLHLTRITLAPPLARRIPTRLVPTVYPLLALLPFLRTHYLGVFIKPARFSR